MLLIGPAEIRSSRQECWLLKQLKKPARTIRHSQEFLEAYRQASYEAQDPGLRQRFSELPKAPISLICCALGMQVNQGGIIRLAEAFRLQSVRFEKEADDAMDLAGARGAGEWLDWSYQDPLEAVQQAKSKGAQTIALTLNDRALPIDRIPWSFPTVLVLGEEKTGMPQAVEEACDLCAAIPLFGMMPSLNVTHAGVIAVWEALSAYRRLNPDFEPARQISLRLARDPESSQAVDGSLSL